MLLQQSTQGRNKWTHAAYLTAIMLCKNRRNMDYAGTMNRYVLIYVNHSVYLSTHTHRRTHTQIHTHTYTDIHIYTYMMQLYRLLIEEEWNIVQCLGVNSSRYLVLHTDICKDPSVFICGVHSLLLCSVQSDSSSSLSLKGLLSVVRVTCMGWIEDGVF